VSMYKIYKYRMYICTICRIYIYTIISRDVTYYGYSIARVRVLRGSREHIQNMHIQNAQIYNMQKIHIYNNIT